MSPILIIPTTLLVSSSYTGDKNLLYMNLLLNSTRLNSLSKLGIYVAICSSPESHTPDSLRRSKISISFRQKGCAIGSSRSRIGSSVEDRDQAHQVIDTGCQMIAVVAAAIRISEALLNQWNGA